MAEGTYEYECMRAELLGQSKPSLEDFLAKQEAQREEIAEILLNDAEHVNEDLNNVSGGLHELNSILTVTQKKLNRFKSACGSLTNMLKIKVGHGSTDSLSSKDGAATEQGENVSDDETTKSATADSVENPDAETKNEPVQKNNEGNIRKRDLEKALGSQVDKLDSLLLNAENAQYRIAQQNKQMRSFLK